MVINSSDFGFGRRKQSKSKSKPKSKSGKRDMFTMGDMMSSVPTVPSAPSASKRSATQTPAKRQGMWPLTEPVSMSMRDPFAASKRRAASPAQLEREREARQMQANMRQGRAAQRQVEMQYEMAGYDITRRRTGYDFDAKRPGEPTKRIEVKSGDKAYPGTDMLRPDQIAARRRYGSDYVVEKTYNPDRDDMDDRDDERPPYIDDDDDRPDRPDPDVQERLYEIEARAMRDWELRRQSSFG